MNLISKLWHRLWGRNDRDVYFLERVIDIEKLVHDLGVWHISNSKSQSALTLEIQIDVINNNLEHLIWEYNNLLKDDKSDNGKCNIDN